MQQALLRVENLSIDYHSRWRTVHALSKVSMELREGETLGIVGESGSGKSTLALAIARLLDARTATYKQGKIYFTGIDMVSASESTVHQTHGPGLFMIFQDPFLSLNPLMKVKDQLIEAISVRCKTRREEFHESRALEEAEESLRSVRIGDAADVAQRYPHQLSGGQNQRVMLAMALCEKPKLLIADEPTTALDVTTQVQVLHLIQEIVQRENMSVLLITHDLAIAGSICDTLAVMYGGIIQEMGPTERILRDPRHPYTVALIKSVPSKTKTEGKLEAITGSFTETAIQKECAFAPRCPSAWDACRKGVPSLLSCDGRLVRCVNYGESYEN